MISKVIYFVDGWVKTNIGAHASRCDAEALSQRCIADAAKAGFTSEQLEEDLGTDLLDFLTSELEARELARASRRMRPDIVSSPESPGFWVGGRLRPSPWPLPQAMQSPTALRSAPRRRPIAKRL
jgi:hypothetical protein